MIIAILVTVWIALKATLKRPLLPSVPIHKPCHPGILFRARLRFRCNVQEEIPHEQCGIRKIRYNNKRDGCDAHVTEEILRRLK